MTVTKIKQLYRMAQPPFDQTLTVNGWIRTSRSSNSIGFIELNDGSFFKNLQIVFEPQNVSNYAEVAKMPIATALQISGTLIHTPDAKQAVSYTHLTLPTNREV